jgi:hypothetical protein
MIELRWFTRDSNLDVGWGGPPVYEKERVLQYRQKIDVTVRAGQWDAAGIAQTANWQWSEWKDVPEVTDGQ